MIKYYEMQKLIQDAVYLKEMHSPRRRGQNRSKTQLIKYGNRYDTAYPNSGWSIKHRNRAFEGFVTTVRTSGVEGDIAFGSRVDSPMINK
jgi:hypothetical protein